MKDSPNIRPGMRVLDLGCGTAISSIFLAKEFGLQAWAAETTCILPAVEERHLEIID